MNFRLATPSVLVDLNAIPDLAYVQTQPDGGVRIGGMTRHHTLEKSDIIARSAPLVRDAMPFVAHLAIRTRGTIGGSLAHADPAAELPAVMAALDAEIVVQGSGGSRRVRAEDFFVGLFTTSLEPGELVTAIEIPAMASRSGWAFEEVSRRHGDFALAGVAAVVTCDDAGRCTGARIALLSVGDRPMLAANAASMLAGQTPSSEAIEAAAEAAAAQDIDPTSDIHASAKYRRQLARVLTRRALTRAFKLT
jgi:aerobic carbon-monoxide dehydrogenase medium subunit